jgi:hypothetical protein
VRAQHRRRSVAQARGVEPDGDGVRGAGGGDDVGVRPRDLRESEPRLRGEHRTLLAGERLAGGVQERDRAVVVPRRSPLA